MQPLAKKKYIKRERRHARIRSKISGTSSRPRLSIFRSNKYIYAQLIDDVSGVTIAAATSRESKTKGGVARSREVGLALAKLAGAKNIKKIVFDRGGYIYTGRVKALADAAREGGLEF